MKAKRGAYYPHEYVKKELQELWERLITLLVYSETQTKEKEFATRAELLGWTEMVGYVLENDFKLPKKKRG